MLLIRTFLFKALLDSYKIGPLTQNKYGCNARGHIVNGGAQRT